MEEGIRFLGNSYAAVETGEAQMKSLEISFKTLSPSGVLVYSAGGEVKLGYYNGFTRDENLTSRD